MSLLPYNRLLFVVVVFITLVSSMMMMMSSTALGEHTCQHDTHVLPFLRKHNPPVTIPQYYPDGVLEHGTYGRPINVFTSTKSSRRTGTEYHEYHVEIHNVKNENDYHRQARAQNFVPANATNAQPMRFTVSTLDLFDSSKYCTTVGQSAPDFKGGTINCSTPDHIFTTAKRSEFVDKLIPEAIELMSQKIRVVPLTQPIVGITANMCTHFTIPQSHIDTGVDKTDYVLYVAAGPTQTGNVAWAGLCSNDQTGRPIVGRMNCGPYYMKFTNAYERGKYLKTLAHELSHALGFSADAFANNYNLQSNYNAPHSALSPILEVRGGFQVQKLRSPHVLEATRDFFGCPNYDGLELSSPSIAGAGSSNSHPSRRVLFESYMTAVQGETNAIDNLTLSVFADMQYYFPDLSRAEQMYFGNNSGCSFLDEPCNSTTMKMSAQQLFCANDTTPVQQCTYNLHGIGKCDLANYVDDLVSFFQYYKGSPRLGGKVALMQYCPFVSVFSNNRCQVGNISTGDATSVLLGHTHGNGGRCVNAPTLIKSGFLPPTTAPSRCLIIKCLRQETYLSPDPNYRIQIQIRENTFVDCPMDGSSATVNAPSGWSGTLTCPSAYDVCPQSSKGWGDDIIYEELPPITTSSTTTTTLTTFYYDNNGSTYTLSSTTSTTDPSATETAVSSSETATTVSGGGSGSSATSSTPAPPTPVPPTTTTSDPRYQSFTISLPAIYSDVFAAVLANNKTGLLEALLKDLKSRVPSLTVAGVSLASNIELSINVELSNLNELSSFNSLVANGNINSFLDNTANMIASESNNPSITPSILAVGSSALIVSTTALPGNTTAAPGNNNGGGLGIPSIPPEACFIKDQPCWISYAIISTAVSAVVGGVVWFCKKKKGDEDENDTNRTERDKWSEEYGMRGNGNGGQSPISHMNHEMTQYAQQNQRRPSALL